MPCWRSSSTSSAGGCAGTTARWRRPAVTSRGPSTPSCWPRSRPPTRTRRPRWPGCTPSGHGPRTTTRTAAPTTEPAGSAGPARPVIERADGGKGRWAGSRRRANYLGQADHADRVRGVPILGIVDELDLAAIGQDVERAVGAVLAHDRGRPVGVRVTLLREQLGGGLLRGHGGLVAPDEPVRGERQPQLVRILGRHGAPRGSDERECTVRRLGLRRCPTAHPPVPGRGGGGETTGGFPPHGGP